MNEQETLTLLKDILKQGLGHGDRCDNAYGVCNCSRWQLRERLKSAIGELQKKNEAPSK